MPFSRRIRSPAGFVGPFAPSAMTLQSRLVASLSPIWFSSAHGAKMSAFVLKNSSRVIALPPG